VTIEETMPISGAPPFVRSTEASPFSVVTYLKIKSATVIFE
jgi:hypothetical protein